MLWAEGGPIGWIALLVNTAALVLTGDIPLTILLILTRNLHLSAATLSGKIVMVVLARPVPLILLVMGIFYLWVYIQRSLQKSRGRNSPQYPA
jgi:ABC-type enterobactin transport system permease subunit